MPSFTFFDLFAGIGGFRLALQNLGGKCLGFSEIAPDAIHYYCTNFRENPNLNFGDITKIKDLPYHDFMTAGVPCQSWSIAGKNLGFDDDRGQLWNDTLYLLNKVRPKVFIFENVKGLADPRNQNALNFILKRIAEAGYYADYYLLNACDYGIPQTRVRIYIIGFKEKKYFNKFKIPSPNSINVRLSSILDHGKETIVNNSISNNVKSRWSLSCNNQGFNDYFLFNDLRNGSTTVHSWDIQNTTERQKQLCTILLTNRRKKNFGILDGNPLSLKQFQSIDPSITQEELDELVELYILKEISYLYKITDYHYNGLTDSQKLILSFNEHGILNIDKLKTKREFKIRKISVSDTLTELMALGIITCIEKRYDFKNTKISTGLNGINRIFLPSSNIYPTLVASDTNDFVTSVTIEAKTIEDYKEKFIKEVFEKQQYRKISKSEACKLQGFPADYQLPESRARWMKLIGNSVAVPVVQKIAKEILKTGVFGDKTECSEENLLEQNEQNIVQLSLFDKI